VIRAYTDANTLQNPECVAHKGECGFVIAQLVR